MEQQSQPINQIVAPSVQQKQPLGIATLLAVILILLSAWMALDVFVKLGEMLSEIGVMPPFSLGYIILQTGFVVLGIITSAHIFKRKKSAIKLGTIAMCLFLSAFIVGAICDMLTMSWFENMFGTDTLASFLLQQSLSAIIVKLGLYLTFFVVMIIFIRHSKGIRKVLIN